MTTENDQPDWRVTDGPNIGQEPLFDLSEIRLHSRFITTGEMLRDISGTLTTATPTLVESIGRPLSALSGSFRIYSYLPDRAFSHLFGQGYGAFELHGHRGVLAFTARESFLVHLYLPAEQFEQLLPMLGRARSRVQLRIEIERTLDQGVFEEDVHFWNDRVSPIILFNEFEIIADGQDERIVTPCNG